MFNMPYLNQDFRSEINIHGSFERTSSYMSSLKPKDFAGGLNYYITKLVKRYLKKNGKKYWILALIVGTLVCTIFELYRKVISNYEDEKIKINGEVK